MLEKDLIETKNPFWKSVLIAFIEKHSLERAAAVHVTSRREADQARSFGFALPPLCEIPNGVEGPSDGGAISASIKTAADAGPYALYLGRINWKKGLDRLARALPHAPRVRLVIAGNDEEDYRSTLGPLLAAHGVADRVTFTGPVGGADKSYLLQHARLVVLPSYSENFGNTVLEAMAAGRPVVVTPEVGAADLVREASAGLVVEGDPVSLGAAIARVVDSAAEAAAMGQRGRMLATSAYTWDAVADRMETLYERVAAGQPGC